MQHLAELRCSFVYERSRSSDVSGYAILLGAAHLGRLVDPGDAPPAWLAPVVNEVLCDLEVTDLTPSYRDEPEPRNFGVVGFSEPDGRYFGFGVSRTGFTADLLVSLADGIQENLSETQAHWGEALPPCPRHPHPLRPIVADGTAWWSCPRDGSRIARIGALRRR